MTDAVTGTRPETDSWADMTRDQRVAAIRTLLAEGLTRDAIARELAAPTRNVVVGLIYRYLAGDEPAARSRREGAPNAGKIAAAAAAKKGAAGRKPAPKTMSRGAPKAAPKPAPAVIVSEGPEDAAAAALAAGAEAIVIPAAADPAPVAGKRLLDLGTGECRYPLAGGLFCGAPVARALESWCACHRAVVYVSPAQRKEAKAAAAAFFGGARTRLGNTLVSPRQR